MVIISLFNVFCKDFGHTLEFTVGHVYNSENKDKEKPKRGDGRLENKEANLKRASQRAGSNVRALIIANDLSYLWTLTYKEEITERSQVDLHFDRFLKRIKYAIKDSGKSLKYIAVKEIQEERAKKYGVRVWHLHVAFNQFIKHHILEKAWQHGYVLVSKFTVEGKSKTENLLCIGGYMAKYVKKGMNNYHQEEKKRYLCSKGLERPDSWKIQMTDEEIAVLKEVASVNLEFTDEVEGKDGEKEEKKNGISWVQLTDAQMQKYAELIEERDIECSYEKVQNV